MSLLINDSPRKLRNFVWSCAKQILTPLSRLVTPELLDALSHDDPAAQRSRRELRLINIIMGNHRWLCRTLQEQGIRHKRVLELGAGDGALARQLWGKSLAMPAHWSALDLAPMPADWPPEATWHQGDLFFMPKIPEADIIVSNLFLHHFQEEQLRDLGMRLPESCRVFIACEPARRRIHALQGWLLSTLVNLCPVTHHDMLVSIHAGFVGDELKRALGLHDWQTKVSLTAFGAYHFLAWR